MDDGHTCQIRQLLVFPKWHRSAQLGSARHEPCVPNLFVVKTSINFVQLGLDSEEIWVSLPSVASDRLVGRELGWVDRVSYLNAGQTIGNGEGMSPCVVFQLAGNSIILLILGVVSLDLLFRQNIRRLFKQDLRYVLNFINQTWQTLNAVQTERVEASAVILLLLVRKAFRR